MRRRRRRAVSPQHSRVRVDLDSVKLGHVLSYLSEMWDTTLGLQPDLFPKDGEPAGEFETIRLHDGNYERFFTPGKENKSDYIDFILDWWAYDKTTLQRKYYQRIHRGY